MKTAQHLFSQISYLDKVLFTKHLSVMIKSGIPLTEAISTLIEGNKSAPFKKVLNSILQKIENGQSLAKSMKEYDYVFDNFYRSLIQVGEESGTLEENLEFLSEQLKKSYSLKKKVQGAMMYPGMVLGSAAIMGGFISFYVLPKLADFFSAFEVKLPLATRILLFIANSLKNYGVFILLGILLLIIFGSLLYQIRNVKFFVHNVILKIPLLGKFFLDEQLARFCRNFGIMLQSGVPITKSLEITAETLSNLKFSDDIKKISLMLSQGKNIGEAIKRKNFWEFPPLVSRMISVGEKTGKLDEVLLYLADFYEEEIDETAKNLSTVIEPILLVSIGLVVAFVAVAIISPIYELTGSISR